MDFVSIDKAGVRHENIVGSVIMSADVVDNLSLLAKVLDSLDAGIEVIVAGFPDSTSDGVLRKIHRFFIESLDFCHFLSHSFFLIVKWFDGGFVSS